MMAIIEHAKQFLKIVTYRLFVTSNDTTNFKEYWSKARKYRLKFITTSDFTGSSVLRKEYFVTNNDNTNMIKILKLVDSLIQTNSYDDLILKNNCLRILGVQAGQGNFCITVKLIENNEHLQIIVETQSNR